jgi:tetratricopeptide (TPR) repeat protein
VHRVLLLLLGAGALGVQPLPAQSPELARIDSLIDHSRFTQARTALRQWGEGSHPGQQVDDVAYAIMLRARLATRADTALAAWLELALAHPSSRHAPLALLRLGQGYSALGQHERAAAWLERIPRDFPRFNANHLALLWLARSQRAAGRATAACANLARARNVRTNDATSRRLVDTELAACPASPVPAPTAGKPASTAGQRGAVRPGRAEAASEGRYTVQAGAFRNRDAALALARRLRQHDIPARVVIMARGALNLVRAGRFRTRPEAAPLLRLVQALVPAAVLAGDAHREAGASR